MFKQKLGIISVLSTTLPLLLFTANSAFAANLIQNGSFETGPNPGTSSIRLTTGSTAIDNWTVTDDDIEYIESYWIASDGQRSLDLSGSQPGAIAQTFNTTIGQSYLVTFDLAGNPTNNFPTIKTMTVGAAGQSEDFSFDITGKTLSNMGWTPQSWQFRANDNQTTLEFSSLTPNAPGPALDNVAVVPADTPVPEPGTILGSLTLLGLGTLSRRKKAH